MKLSREGQVRGLWSLVFAGGFGIEIVALHRCIFECDRGCEYGGARLLVGSGDLPDGLGLRGPVIMMLMHRFLGLCVFHLRVGFLNIPLVALSTVVRSFPGQPLTTTFLQTCGIRGHKVGLN